MKILIFASWYKNQANPIAGSFIEEQARLLVKQGHEVTVCHPYLKGRFFETISQRASLKVFETDQGLPTLRLGVAPVFPGLRQKSYKKLCILAEKELLEYFKTSGMPDIIHSHSAFMGGVVAAEISKKIGIPFFHTEHTSGLAFNPDEYTHGDIKSLKKVYSLAKKVFFVSQFSLDKTITNFKLNSKNFQVLHNVVDDSFFRILPLPQNKPSFKYLLVGSLIPRKGLPLLLKSWEKHLSHFPDSFLTIAGDGYLKEKLVELSKESGIDHSMQWLPRLNRKEIIETIDEHQVVVSASQVETFGLTVAEALARGKPVVVTNSGGVMDIVNPECGVITDQTEDALFEGLNFVRKNYGKFNPQQIQDYCRSKFGSEVIYQKLMIEYQRVELKPNYTHPKLRA